MTDQVFLIVLATVCAVVLGWGITSLPSGRWQFLATVPFSELRSGRWRGMNLTGYGFWTATAVLVAVGMFVLLLRACAVPPVAIALFVILELAACLPAARLLAGWIEGKPATFTIGATSVLGLVLAPGVVWLINASLVSSSRTPLPFLVTLAALTIAYAFGEGLGRLACLSFGCCYGKPISMLPRGLQTVTLPLAVIFRRPTYKAVYEGGLAGTPLIPVQAMTAAVGVVGGLAGLAMFLRGEVMAAFLVSMLTMQLWRVAAEYLRADYRGKTRVTLYHWAALFGTMATCVQAALFSGEPTPIVNLSVGLTALWEPATLLGLQIIWWGVFLYTGLSRVTDSTIMWRLRPNRI